MAGVLRTSDNPVVFLDLHANKQDLGRVTIELFRDLCPRAAESYRQLCTGEWEWRGRPAGYKDTCLHKVVGEKYLEGGDFVTHGHGSPKPRVTTAGEDVLIEREDSSLKHSQEGLLTLVGCHQRGAFGNLFRLTAGPCWELEGQCEVVGQLVDEASLKVLRGVAGCEVSEQFRPKYPVVVRQCGEM